MGKKTPKKVSSYLLGFLRGINKPQRIYFLIYLVGLIWLVKFRSIREIAHEFGSDNTDDGLHQFLKASPKGAFKSKVQIAIEILSAAIRKIRTPLTVLMDSWYACAPILNLIIQAEWTFLAAIKRNRIVEVGGRKTTLGRLAKGPRKYKTIRDSKKKRFRVTKFLVHLPKIGSVLLFISKSKDGTRFFVTNNLKMTESQRVSVYLQRVWIETFHQDAKQHLGFGEMFMRSWNGVQTTLDHSWDRLQHDRLVEWNPIQKFPSNDSSFSCVGGS
jgi:hypothetical protein